MLILNSEHQNFRIISIPVCWLVKNPVSLMVSQNHAPYNWAVVVHHNCIPRISLASLYGSFVWVLAILINSTCL